MSTAEQTGTARAPARPDWRFSMTIGWFALALPLTVLAVAAFFLTTRRTIADLFFFTQDFPLLLVLGGALMGLRMAPAAWLARLPLAGALEARPRVWLAVLALGVAAIAGAGWFLVCHAYPLSMDEFMVGFDAAIFGHGRPTAALPPEWRPFAFPLQPQFIIQAPGGAAWSSLYLPGNAALHALFGLFGAAWATGAACAVVSVATVYSLARQFWPGRPDAAVVAALLLATSPQFLITAMTPYAMSAHLAFNLVWLWLFLRPDWRSQLAAMGVAAFACGLHQVVFHPLFAAPFVAELWLSRRWGRAAAHTAAYAAIGLFWLVYLRLVLPGGGIGADGASDLGVELMAKRVSLMLAGFSLSSLGVMTQNLVRFLTWQNPLLPALAAAGGWAAVRQRGVFRNLLAGAALTLVVVWVLMPFQGHGWGYRYWHGFLGSFALVAALGWAGLTERLSPFDRRAADGLIVAAAAVSLGLSLPVRAAQVSAMIRPYAAAARAIARTPAEVVLVDPAGLFYAADLVRNDPWLASGPKVMDLGVMTDDQVRAVCALHAPALFEQREGLALGMETDPAPRTGKLASRRALLTQLHCGARTVPTSS